MKAVVFNGPRDVSVEQVDDPRIEKPQDAIIKITTANICGSDLHPYEGRAPLDKGMVLGHENMGVVTETGPGVDRISVGDRVSVPFNISCGTCRNCVAGWTNACLRANPSGRPTAGYGYPQMGPYWGGQAEYLRVPWADFNLLKLPAGTEHENDFTMLSDIFPTGYHGTELAGVSPGATVAIFGAGPVGLMAAHSAVLRGAAQVFVVDKEADRLALAEKFGATPVNFAGTDPAEFITDATDGAGVDCGVEAVGYQAHDQSGRSTRNWCWTSWSRWCGPPAASAWSGCTTPKTPAPPPRVPRKAGTGSTTAWCSTRTSRWATASARSSVTTTSCGT